MEVQQLRYFITVVESGSLSRAAKSLLMSQPALSQQMRALEQSLHTTLLERSSRGVRATANGEALYRDAYRLVREFDHLATSVTALSEVRGVVSVGLPSGAAGNLAAPLVTSMLDKHPGIRLELFDAMSGYIRELFDQGRMDIALFYEEPFGTDHTAPGVGTQARSGRDTTRVPLYQEEMYAFGSLCSDHARDGQVSLESLAALPLVAPGIRSSLRRLINDAFRARALRPAIVADLESLPTMLEITRSGSAYAILPISADRHGEVPRFRITGAQLRRQAVLNVSKSRSTAPSALDAILTGITATADQAIEKSDTTGFLPVAR